MRAAIAIGALVVAGGLGAFGAVEAQKYTITKEIAAAIRSAIAGPNEATAAAAPVEAPPMQPQAPRTVVTEIPMQATAPQAAAPAPQAAPLPPVQVAAAQPAPAPKVAPAPQTTAAAPATPAVPPAPAPAAPTAHAAPPPIPMPMPPPITCNNPNALGISRVVQIDTTGGPGFGMEHFRTHDFLNDHEVVLTFDDGPWLNNTPMVLKALADQCIRATFFPIGLHSTYYPEILKQVAAAGNTIGSHTWSHKDLSKLSIEDAKREIEMGMSAVRTSLGAPFAPFFRFPALRH